MSDLVDLVCFFIHNNLLLQAHKHYSLNHKEATLFFIKSASNCSNSYYDILFIMIKVRFQGPSLLDFVDLKNQIDVF